MRLVLATFALALGVGYIFGGRLSNLGRVRVRWAPAAMIGLAMQFAPLPGKTLPLLMLYASFVVLTVFAAVNIRLVGFPLIAIGICCNFLVIGVNRGMPVTEDALVASGQASTLRLLIEDGGAKHHLANDSDVLLFLGDVIPLGPLQQAVSVGDVLTYGGVMWLIVAGMRGRIQPALRPEVQHVGG
ncbi:MAG: DUF5317 domain-containing protein [Actinobacteria bacterium]|nr:DUF5317 domain-containing protein [Actinomycetota bacterium]